MSILCRSALCLPITHIIHTAVFKNNVVALILLDLTPFDVWFYYTVTAKIRYNNYICD